MGPGPAEAPPSCTPPPSRRSVSAPSSGGSGSTGIALHEDPAAADAGYTPDSAFYAPDARPTAGVAPRAAAAQRPPRVPRSAFAAAAAQLPAFVMAAGQLHDGCGPPARQQSRGSASPAGSAMLPDQTIPPGAPQLGPQRTGFPFEGFSVATGPAQFPPWSSLQGSGCAEDRGAALGNAVDGAPRAASESLHAVCPYLGPLPPVDWHPPPVQQYAPAGSTSAALGKAAGLRTASMDVVDLRTRIDSLRQQHGGGQGAPLAMPALLPSTFSVARQAQQMQQPGKLHQGRASNPQARHASPV